MGALFDLFRRRTTLTSESVGRGMRNADAAIRDSRVGRLAVQAMLETVLDAQILIPLSEPPHMTGLLPERWKPATVTKQTDGSRFVVAFTNANSLAVFSRTNPEYSHSLLVEAQWMLDAIPADHGIVFNVGGENGFEWPAAGISAFMAGRS